MISLICRILNKQTKRTYSQNRNRLTDLENGTFGSQGGRGGERIDWELGLTCKEID